jgi:hypothetical protein
MPHPEHAIPPFDYRACLAMFDADWRQYQQAPSPTAYPQLRAAENVLTQALEQPGKFRLGLVVATPGAMTAVTEAQHHPAEFLLRHTHGDWGELDPEDVQVDEQALRRDQRLLSAYRTRLDEKLWVITEWDRSVTTLLLTDEY